MADCLADKWRNTRIYYRNAACAIMPVKVWRRSVGLGSAGEWLRKARLSSQRSLSSRKRLPKEGRLAVGYAGRRCEDGAVVSARQACMRRRLLGPEISICLLTGCRRDGELQRVAVIRTPAGAGSLLSCACGAIVIMTACAGWDGDDGWKGVLCRRVGRAQLFSPVANRGGGGGQSGAPGTLSDLRPRLAASRVCAGCLAAAPTWVSVKVQSASVRLEDTQSEAAPPPHSRQWCLGLHSAQQCHSGTAHLNWSCVPWTGRPRDCRPLSRPSDNPSS
ncbi:hypothetical protein BU26DRAFT_252736 [Trematosphaeria pertusa]|uniref:Uncharacterized protein n=1 Tax=Trematosphaeria pertusa TaxID=390896 RepID=A0A6A6INU7_9PLEO|nr:uncharacterized protein BU26DRAFT_252736 [Trematosphaeria pertusa]KAF2252205.1 hypothetical protein BU26DRAFT_252736 [Trematosphaeria pertusa]